MEIYVKKLCYILYIHSFSFSCLNHYFITHTDFTRVAASNTETDDVTN